jgi:tetratricopeptide (TPR) repeat protein
MKGIDPSQHLRRMLAGSLRHASHRREAATLLSTDPELYLPIAVAAAMDFHANEAQPAADLLEEWLGTNPELSLQETLYHLLPRQSNRLNAVAVRVATQLLQALVQAGPPDAICAMLLNNISEWSAEQGDLAKGLAAATQAVTLLETLSASDPGLRDDLLIALMTLAKRTEAAGDVAGAIRIGERALSLSAEMSASGDPLARMRCCQAANTLATRHARAGRRDQALSLVRDLPAELRQLARAGFDVEQDLAGACHIMANALVELGQFARALPHATRAFDGFGRLVAGNRDAFLSHYLAAANTLSICQANCGQVEASVDTAGRGVDLLAESAEAQPQRYGAEFISYLINHSTNCAEAGQLDQGLTVGRHALGEIRRLGRWLGKERFWLEGIAWNNLFNQAYAAHDAPGALKAAEAAARCFRRCSDMPDGPIELVRANRNAVEAIRLLGNDPITNRKALRRAEAVLAEAIRLPEPWSDTVSFLVAQVHSVVANCLADLGRDEEAVAREEVSLALRRQVNGSPAERAAAIAASFRFLATHRLNQGQTAVASDLLREAVRNYRLALKSRGGTSFQQELDAALQLQKLIKANQARRPQ